MNFGLCRRNKLEPGKAEAAEEASAGCHQMMLQALLNQHHLLALLGQFVKDVRPQILCNPTNLLEVKLKQRRRASQVILSCTMLKMWLWSWKVSLKRPQQSRFPGGPCAWWIGYESSGSSLWWDAYTLPSQAKVWNNRLLVSAWKDNTYLLGQLESLNKKWYVWSR